jgi:mono/diheme cytochrome c family protein
VSYLLRSHTIARHTGLITLALLFSLLFNSQTVSAQDGKALFQTNCASCHNPVKDATGPALQGKSKEVPSREWIYNWVHNSAKVIASGDKYANDLFNKWNKTAMTAFPNLTHEEIDAIIKYVDEYKAPGAATPEGGPAAQPVAQDNTWLYTIITILLALTVIVLTRVNKTLKRVTNDQEGIPNKKEVPLLRNKIFIAIASILLMVLAGYWIVNGAVSLGRQQNYMPKQPIFYSHKVHAGVNQISCLYCHAGAEKSRQAMIPSTNVCMNCHKQISEYTGTEKLVTYEGKEINGTAQIQELYKYAGWDPKKKEYKRDAAGNIMATPIEWVKVHNLSDFVYFNHSQHVSVGQVQCQTCHGEITAMDEVHQFAPLSMGWCINCHRQTNVQFKENDYYSIFQKYHDEIKAGKREGVTEAELGGTECAKCHY